MAFTDGQIYTHAVQQVCTVVDWKPLNPAAFLTGHLTMAVNYTAKLTAALADLVG